MQNTVATVEHNALNLSSNAYMNSTTKFVKGIQPAPATTSSKTIIPASLSSIAVGKQQNTQSAINLSSLIFKPAPQSNTTGEGDRKSSKKSPSKNEGNNHMSDIQLTAINLSANIFMNATTKFMKGYADLSPVKKANSRSPKQKKSLSEGKKVEKSPKKTIDPQAKPSSSSIKKQKTPQKNALDMTASNYMTSTTKYVKPSPQGSMIDPAKGKIQKIVRNNNKIGRIQSRDKGENQKSNGKGLNGERSIDHHSKSSSEGKLSRRKDRTRQIKFIEKKQPEESLETVKDRPKSIDFNTKRNDTKIQPEKATPKPQISQLILNSYHYNPNQDSKQISMTPSISNLDPKPPLNRLARNTINVVKSADTKRSDVKEQNSKPFSRQPQNARPQLIQKTHQMAKAVSSLPSGQLPLQTPMKLKVESSKLITTKEESHINKPIQRANYKQTAQISVIKEERSSALQNTKTSINTKRSVNQGSTKEGPSSTHIYENHTQIVGSKNNDNSKISIAKNTSSKFTTKEEPSDVMHASYGLAKVNSASNIKSQEKVVDPIDHQGKRQLAKKQENTVSAKEIQVQTRKNTIPSILQEKKLPIQRSQKQIQSKMTAKTQSQDRGSKTSIDEPTIDSTKRKPIVVSQNNQINITSQSKLQQIKPQESLSSNNIKANDIIKLIPIGVGQSSQINTTSQNRPQQIKPQESPRNNNTKTSDNGKQIAKPVSPRQSIKSSNIKSNDNDRQIVKPIPTTVVQNNQTSQIKLQPIKPQESSSNSNIKINDNDKPIAKPINNVVAQNNQTNITSQNKLQPVKPQETASSNNIKDNGNDKQIVKPISSRQSIKPANEIKRSQQKEKPKEESAKKISNLKRSDAIVQTSLKIYIKLLKGAFYSILNQSTIAKKHSKQAQILAYGALNTYKNIQKQFKLSSFEQIKKIAFTKLPIKTQISENLYKEIASSIIFRTFILKERVYFQELKSVKTFNAPHHRTQNLSKKQSIKQAKDLKIYPLQQLAKIIRNFLQNKLHQIFNKLTLFATQKQPSIQQTRSPPKQTKPLRDYQGQKLALVQTKSQLQTTIASMQSRITDKKRQSDLEKSKLLKKQDDLTKKNKAIDAELLEKRKKNKELKNQVEHLSQQGQDLDISLPEYEPLIGILTEIYSTIFASKDQAINIEPLIKKYQLNKQDHNPLLDQWESLIQNARLISQVSKWQGNDPFNRPNEKLVKEYDVICKLTRSYIRERYLWEWVKISAQKV